MNKQKTLNGSFSLFGKGLHTGLSLTVTFNPAPENHGYKIQRIDLPGEPIIDAVAENVTETTRGTVSLSISSSKELAAKAKRASTSVTPFSIKSISFNDSVIATAILDRLLHHSHVFQIDGPSYRTKDIIQ